MCSCACMDVCNMDGVHVRMHVCVHVCVQLCMHVCRIEGTCALCMYGWCA